MEEFRKLKETLKKMPSFKDAGTAKEQQMPPRFGQPLGSSVLQFARPEVQYSRFKCPSKGLTTSFEMPGGKPGWCQVPFFENQPALVLLKPGIFLNEQTIRLKQHALLFLHCLGGGL